MTWVHSILDRLEVETNWGYSPGGKPASEPAALAAMALAAHGRKTAAARAARWLMDIQSTSGSVGISAEESSPQWPTGLAVLAWRSALIATTERDDIDSKGTVAGATARAVNWLLKSSGEKLERSAALKHDSTLQGWSWVEGTHSWIEPTAFAVLALKASGLNPHPRAREGVALMLDRLLPSGGCNYGNTVVLGQTLRPHLQPSGLVLTALASEADATGRVDRTMTFVEESVGPETTAASLAWAIIGLAAHGRLPIGFDRWLESAAERTARRGATLPRLTLLALAALGSETPFVTLTRSRGSA